MFVHCEATVSRIGLSRRENSVQIVKRICLAALVSIAVAGPVAAQDESLVQELQRLRRDLSDLQRHIYRGTGAPPPNQSVAAPANETAATAHLQRQILEIQTQLRELTGHIERVQHDVRLVGGRLDKLVADVDLRLQALEGGRPVTSIEPRTGMREGSEMPSAGSSQETTVITSSGVSGGTPVVRQGLAPGQKSLGTISEKDLAAFGRGDKIEAATPATAVTAAPVAGKPVKPAKMPEAQAAPAPGSVTASRPSVASAVAPDGLPEGTANQQYEYAFGKLKQRDYDQAEAALRAFVERHPDDPLAGNAMYWMGETYYVRKQFPEAARIFLDAYQRFPKGNKAADNLFKLAKSLAQIGETTSACTTYVELVKSFPNANARILSGAQTDMKSLGCS